MKKTKETEAAQAGTSKYLVAVDTMGRHVEIILEGHKPSEGHRTVGEFEANVVDGLIVGEDDFDTHGDHLLIAKSRAILNDLEITDLDDYVFEDKASNAPSGDSYVMSHTDRDRAVRDGENPAEKQAQVADNIDKAEAKLDKKNQKHKNDARPRGE